MTIALTTDTFRGDRRIRLFFSGPLAVGAFAPSLYGVVSADGMGASPINVEAAFAIATDPNAVEISVDSNFTPGGLYTITCTSVPGVSGPNFTGSISDRVGQPVASVPNVEPETDDYQLLLYFRDIQWDGTDFDEDTTGDLATVTGRPNFQGALTRRMISDGLTWDSTYGAKAGQAVDAPSAFQPALAGQFLSQCRLDPRTLQASIAAAQDPLDPNGDSFIFNLTVTGKDGLNPVTLPAPIPVGTPY